MREIPDSWRPEAKAAAKKLLAELQAAGALNDRVNREMNRISENEWRKDKEDWRAWMRMMSCRSMHSTPHARVLASPIDPFTLSQSRTQ